MEQAKETKLPALLGVFEVHPDHRVRCQAPGCTRTVYKRIHVVREEDGLHVYGSDCFEQLFIGQSIFTAKPEYTDKQPSRVLTEDERLELTTNTELFIERMEQLYRIEQERLHQEILALAAKIQKPKVEPSERSAPETALPSLFRGRKVGLDQSTERSGGAQVSTPQTLADDPGKRIGRKSWTPTPDPDEKPYVSMLDDKGKIKAHPVILDQAMANIRKRHNVNPELPGWMGLVMHEVKRLQDEVPEPTDLFDPQ